MMKLTTHQKSTMNQFTYKGFRCKYFVQTIEQAGRLYNVNKPACEIGPGQWVSIENW